LQDFVFGGVNRVLWGKIWGLCPFSTSTVINLPFGNNFSGKVMIRESSFRESDDPGIIFPVNVSYREKSPGNVFPGKRPPGKVTIRETTVNPAV